MAAAERFGGNVPRWVEELYNAWHDDEGGPDSRTSAFETFLADYLAEGKSWDQAFLAAIDDLCYDAYLFGVELGLAQQQDADGV